MATGKRYYWLKLKEDFFSGKRIKKLRNMAGGDTYLIIYLKLLLKAMKENGMIQFDHLESTIAEELALDLDESVDNIKVTLMFLLSCGLAETNDETSYVFLPESVENVGSEGASAQRMREARKRTNRLLPAESVTLCAQSAKMCKNGDGEKEIEKEIEIEKDQEQEEAVVVGGGVFDGVVDVVDVDPDGFRKTAEDHNDILNAAARAGFPKNPATWDRIIELYAKFGKDTVMAGISACVKYGHANIAYLQGCCANIAGGIGKPKAETLPPVRKYPKGNIHAYGQRDNAGAQEEALEQMREMIRESRRERGLPA